MHLQVLLYRMHIHLNVLTVCLLKPNKSQSNSSCQETRSGVALGAWENMGMKTSMCLERAQRETVSTSSITSPQDSLEDVNTMDPTPLSPAEPLGILQQRRQSPRHCLNHQGIGWGFVLSPFCPLPWAASLQSEQRDFSLQLLHVCGNLPCLEFRLWLFFSCLSLVTQTLQDFLFTEAVRWLWSAAPFFANQERSATENKSPEFPHGGSAFSQTSYPASDC